MSQKRTERDSVVLGWKQGFTLIELLVVVAIIALLVGLLVPAISGARALAQERKCQNNVRQIMMAALLYAQDNDDGIWPYTKFGRPDGNPDGITIDWKPNFTSGTDEDRWVPGHLHRYIDDADELLECPTSRRAGLAGTDEGLYFTDRYRLQGGSVWFDYTMFWASEGANIGRSFQIAYPENIANFGTVQGMGTNIPRTLSNDYPMTRMRTLPVFVEESYHWENNGGAISANFARGDLWSERHRGAGMTGYIDGSAGLFDAPSDGDPESRRPQDLYAGGMFMQYRNQWVGVGWDDVMRNRPRNPAQANPPYYRYGWINSPEPGAMIGGVSSN